MKTSMHSFPFLRVWLFVVCLGGFFLADPENAAAQKNLYLCEHGKEMMFAGTEGACKQCEWKTGVEDDCESAKAFLKRNAPAKSANPFEFRSPFSKGDPVDGMSCFDAMNQARNMGWSSPSSQARRAAEQERERQRQEAVTAQQAEFKRQQDEWYENFQRQSQGGQDPNGNQSSAFPGPARSQAKDAAALVRQLDTLDQQAAHARRLGDYNMAQQFENSARYLRSFANGVSSGRGGADPAATAANLESQAKMAEQAAAIARDSGRNDLVSQFEEAARNMRNSAARSMASDLTEDSSPGVNAGLRVVDGVNAARDVIKGYDGFVNGAPADRPEHLSRINSGVRGVIDSGIIVEPSEPTRIAIQNTETISPLGSYGARAVQEVGRRVDGLLNQPGANSGASSYGGGYSAPSAPGSRGTYTVPGPSPEQIRQQQWEAEQVRVIKSIMAMPTTPATAPLAPRNRFDQEPVRQKDWTAPEPLPARNRFDEPAPEREVKDLFKPNRFDQ